MLHVLRHYLPVRKILLIASEMVLLTWVVSVGISSHLWEVDESTARLLAIESLSLSDARILCVVTAFLISVIAQIAISFNELYDFRVSTSPHARAQRFVSSAAGALALSLTFLLFMEVWQFERVLAIPALPLTHKLAALTISLIVAFLLLFVWRNVFHALLQRFDFNERVLVLGNGSVAKKLVREMQERPNTGYQIVAMVSDSTAGSGKPDPRGRRASDIAPYSGDDALKSSSLWKWQGASESQAVPTPGNGNGNGEPHQAGTLLVESPPTTDTEAEPTSEFTSSLLETVRRLQIDDIVVALEERRGSLPIHELLQCRLRGVVVEEAEALFERVTGKIAVLAMRPSYLIFNSGFRLHPLGVVGKRLMDFALASLVLFLTWPAMLLTAIAIRLDSPGPILFRQERMGVGGKPFTLMKFRSMREDAEKLTGPVWAQEDDPRITRVGSFIRRTRLDELPQLFNVLVGSMSMVGPRPERAHFVEELASQLPYYHQRHMCKPGLTGWAQINYPYGNTVEDALQKLQYDLFYIKYQSLMFDASILFNTIKTVVLRKGT